MSLATASQLRSQIAASKRSSEVARAASGEHVASGMPRFLQAKRAVSEPDDPLEQEADQVGEVAATPEAAANTKTARPQHQPESTSLSGIDGGSALNDGVRRRVEPLLGADLGDVRVHHDDAAAQATQALEARAFTHRNHIWLGRDERADDTELMAHEATHVVHQSRTSGGGGGVAETAAPIQRQDEEPSSDANASAPMSATESPVASDLDALDTLATDGAAGPTTEPGDGAGDDSGEAESSASGASGDGGAAGADAPPGADAMSIDGGAGESADGATADGAAGTDGETSLDSAAAVADAVSDSGAGALSTGDLALIDVELAEHERWAGASARVGAAGSVDRAAFVAEAAGGGFLTGAGTGFAMGVGIGLATRFVPAIGPLIGGGMALHGLITRDWSATGDTIAAFGEGGSTYEILANSIASVSAVIDIVSQALTVINGIVGIVQIAAAVIAGGAVIAAVVTAGATLAIAAIAAEVVATCEEISLAIGEATMVLDGINAAVLNPAVALFRALHAFTSEADPSDVESQGREISNAASASGAALGGWAGSHVANVGRPRPPVEEPPNQHPPHDAPPPAAGDGPVVNFETPHPITPDVEIRGDFSDSSIRVGSGENTGAAQAGDINIHQHQGTRGPDLISEHVVPGAQVRDASFDPAHNAPDWERSTPPRADGSTSDGADYNNATTIVEHAAVSDRKTALDNAETRRLQNDGGPENLNDDLLLPSLERHQQAVDDAIAAGEITPDQATDPTHRALAAQAEMWGGGARAGGGAKARADAAAAGTTVPRPRRPDRMRDAERARAQDRLDGEHIEEPDWDATFNADPPAPAAPPAASAPPRGPSPDAISRLARDPAGPTRGVERVNPNYPPPPATPQQIDAIRDEISVLLANRALAEEEAARQAANAAVCEENTGPVSEMVADTEAGISAVDAHNQAIARREAANQAQTQRQEESDSLVSGYPSRAAGLTALSVPLAAWAGFTELASHLPGEAGASMLQMNQEAEQMQEAFGQMGAEMLGIETTGPANQAALEGDQATLETTTETSGTSGEELNTASAGAASLEEANNAALEDANAANETCTEQAATLGDTAAAREEHADTLAEQLQAWASDHARARTESIAVAESALESRGCTVVRSDATP